MIIVSMTTTSSRIGALPIVISGLLQQSVPADEIVVNLSEDPFLLDEGIAWADVPEPIREHEKVGRVRIEYGTNTGPYRKLLPVLRQRAGQECIIITCDDDVLYTGDWIKGLIDAHTKTDASTAYRARAMQSQGGKLLPYEGWNLIRASRQRLNTEVPEDLKKLLIMPTGRDGILYKPSFFRDVELIDRLRRIAPRQDDVAIRAALIASGVNVEVVAYQKASSDGEFAGVGNGKSTLYRGNRSENDEAISRVMAYLSEHGLFDLEATMSAQSNARS